MSLTLQMAPTCRAPAAKDAINGVEGLTNPMTWGWLGPVIVASTSAFLSASFHTRILQLAAPVK
jgi:hypothetical protein